MTEKTAVTADVLRTLIERVEQGSGPDRGQARLAKLIGRLQEDYTADECWLWPRKLDKRGRGRFWIGGKLKIAHRAVWELIRGKIPDGMLLCHHCDNPTCVNPNHLYVGTPRDNVRDMMVRNRHHATRYPERARAIGKRLGTQNTWVAGEKNPTAKLAKHDVVAIRSSKDPARKLSEQYGVHPTTIYRIKNGDLWKRPAPRPSSTDGG